MEGGRLKGGRGGSEVAAVVPGGRDASESHSWLSLEQKQRNCEERGRGRGRSRKTMVIRTLNKYKSNRTEKSLNIKNTSDIEKNTTVER